MSLLRVFVMLPRQLDASQWPERFIQGMVSDKTPYGYHFAEEMGAKVTFSRPTATPRGPLGIVDKVIKRLLGFDFRHAWNNRNSLFADHFDVVWTHTEYEHLAIAALSKLFRKAGPPIIAQSVWLIDEWERLWGVKKYLYRHLLRRVAVLTFLSPENLVIAQKLRVASRSEMVLFGISLDSYPLLAPLLKFDSTRPIRVLALGNDRHRDWNTLFEAFGARSEFELRVGSSVWPRTLIAENVHVGSMSQDQVRSAYEWADCVVVPLKKNLHASGITAILEAVALGVPVVATRTGGLQAYFDGDSVVYVDAGNAKLLREAINALASNPPTALVRTIAAQQQLVERDLTTRGFALRHVQLSNRLIRDVASRPISVLESQL